MPAARPFRFGVVTGQFQTGARWIENARRLEALGFSTLLVPDTLTWTIAPMPALAAAAAATERLRVGTYVLSNDYRHPLQVAREAAALDVLSGGRFELGMGAGRPTSEADYRALGREREAAGVRVDRLEESLEVIARLLAGAVVTHSGRHYRLEEARLAPPPVQKPRPPLMVAATGPRMLALAGRLADIVAVGATASEAASAVKEKVHAVRRAAGERSDAVEVNLSLTSAGGVVHPEMVRWMGGIDLEELARQDRPTVISGSVDEMCAQLQWRRKELGVSYWSVNDALVDVMTPVVERLTGT